MPKIALAQMNLVVGDIDGNSARIVDAIERARSSAAQLVAVPELAVTGYPPEDLVLKKSFVAANMAAVEHIAAATGDLVAVVGFIDEADGRVFNAAAICHKGEVAAVYHKHRLPNYGVFDERRYFSEGRGHWLLETNDGVIGVCVCEDAWSETGPLVSQGDAGAQLIVNINASPFHKGKLGERAALLGARARRAKASIAYVNTVGGQDELVFDGGSMVVGPDGEIVARSPQFEEDFTVVDVPLGESSGGHGDAIDRLQVQLRPTEPAPGAHITPELDPSHEIYEALRLSLRDYVTKNGFKKIVVGLSGGIDSSITAVIAADAIGPDNVLAIAMPSEFSSEHSIQDAKELSENMGIEMLQIPITQVFHSYLDTLTDAYGKADNGLAEENLQARVRGNLLMATSNRYGHLVVATGNKSEMACGYATLYGDMAGGFALIRDVFKTEVYELCRYRNTLGPAIPENVMTKPPSAELRPDQKDSDSLPQYDRLDPILQAYIEEDASLEDIVAAGSDRATVEKVIALVDRAEYKRRQAPPGPKVTVRAFGRDRRLPITNRWREGAARRLPERSVGRQDDEET
jgi:NAD+ synthase (glutamine-hydrolysing)